MPCAILNPDRTIKLVAAKLSPLAKLLPGEAIVEHNPPDFDAELYTLVPTVPVPQQDTAVSFTLVLQADAAQKRYDRLRRKLDRQIQDALNAFAATRNYDSILSACSYTASNVLGFKADADRCIVLRDTTWVAAASILAAVEQGLRPAPQDISDIAAELPALTWS